MKENTRTCGLPPSSLTLEGRQRSTNALEPKKHCVVQAFPADFSPLCPPTLRSTTANSTDQRGCSEKTRLAWELEIQIRPRRKHEHRWQAEAGFRCLLSGISRRFIYPPNSCRLQAEDAPTLLPSKAGAFREDFKPISVALVGRGQTANPEVILAPTSLPRSAQRRTDLLQARSREEA